LQKQTQYMLSAIFITLIVCFFCACPGKTIAQSLPAAQKGVMDLRQWDFNKNGSVVLKGEWEFYWKKLISPDQFKKNRDLTFEYINAPDSWNKFEIDGKKLSGIGFATYRLKIITREKALGLKILDMSSSSKVYVNGNLICTSGFPASTKEQTIPFYAPSVTALENNSGVLDIVIHVSNFHHWKGGIWEPVYLGKVSKLHAEREKKLVFSSLFFGAIWIIGFYHISLFLIRKKDKSSLIFGIVCLLEGFQTIILGERYFVTIFPTIEFWLLVKLVYLSMYCAVPLFIWYMKTIFPDEMSDNFVKGVLFTGSLLSAFVLFFPSRWFTMSLPVFRIFTICLSIYGAVVLAKAIINKRQGAIVFLTGFIILVTTVVNDIFFAQITIPFGLFSFLFAQAFLISQRYSLAFSTIEKQGEALNIENQQRKIVEHHLGKSKEKYRKMIELLPIPVSEYDFDFNILYANKAALDWFGYTKEDFKSGINVAHLIEDEAVKLIASRLKKQEQGKEPSPLELKLKKKDGSELWGHATSSIIFQNDKPFAFRTCFVDFSEQKKARHDLLQYQEQLRALSSQISLTEGRQRHAIALGLHDKAGQSLTLTRMKLNEITDCTSLNDIKEKLGSVTEIVDQTIEQIRDLTFDLSPPELYQFGIEMALESLCERKSELYDIPIEFFDDKKSKPLNESDCILVYQSARELLFNVIKHASATKIRVSTQHNKNNIEVIIGDNGIGFDTDQTHLSKRINKGFGLFSIQERIHHCGGSFDIKSNPGKGTKATLSVPLKTEKL
jgi:PAS domain S-box-containing protein